MRCWQFGLFLLFSLVSLDVWAQDLPDIERLLEGNDILNTEDGYEEMVDILSNLLMTPVNVNMAGFDSLKMLFLLSDSQIDQLLEFRKKYGNFLHINELLLVPGIGKKDLENIRSFITLGHPEVQDRVKAIRLRSRQELLTRAKVSLHLQEGYTTYSPVDFDTRKEYERKVDNRFHGPPVGLLLKYKATIGQHLQAGLTLENDPGEGYFTRYQKTGFDFLSAHISIHTDRFFQRILLGNYRLQWGQGLVAWGGFASGKSDVVVGNEKSGKGFSPYTSADENNYLKGVALTLKPCRQVTADVFFSRKKTDGNIVQADTLAEEDLLSVSLYESGYHRNNNECRKKHTLEELTTGGAVHWNAPAFKLGLNALYYDFKPALMIGDRIYQQYNDTGHKRFLMSVDYKTSFRGIYWFGETAFSGIGSWATINGLRWGNSFLSACLLYRRYDKKYISHYAAGFGEYSNTSNEEGVYFGTDISPLKNLKINLYYDWFRFFSPRYGATIPGSGWELLGQIGYRHWNWEHRFRLKREIHPEDTKEKISVQREKSEYRYQIGYRVTRQLELRTRFSLSHYHKEQIKEKGFLVYQDLIYATRNSRFKMQYRLAWFKTDSYQSRIYAYENNVLYGYSFPSFMGEGWRTYLNLSWKPLNSLTCYLKSGFTVYPDREVIGSGVTKVEGNKWYDLALQLRFTF